MLDEDAGVEATANDARRAVAAPAMGSAPRPSRWATDVLPAFAISVLQLGIAISLSALIFTGPLADGAGRASSSFILGTGIVTLIVGLKTRMPIAISGAQDTAAIVIAAVAASMVSESTMQPDERVPTVLVTISLCAALTAATFWFLGKSGKTSFVRYLPWPVVTGFTAGTGWLLFRGGVEIMHGSGIEVTELFDLFAWDNAQRIVPGLILATLMVLLLLSRLPNTAVSMVIVAASVGFHLVGRQFASATEIEDGGWLIGPFPDDTSWQPVSPADLAATEWVTVLEHVLPIVAVVAVSVVGLLLNLSGLEAILDTEIDLDHEVKLSGVANVGVAVSGGLLGWHLIGDTALADRLGARGRFVPLATAVAAGLVFASGPAVIGLMPRSVAGGVLAALGLNLLVDWIRLTMPRLNRTDRLTSLGILAGIAVLGVLPGVGLGVLVATGLFLTRYSRIDPARHVIDAAGRSNVDRSATARSTLEASSGAILAIELHGYLFFGSTMRIRELIEVRGISNDPLVQDGDGLTRFLVLDLERVTGVDSTAASSLTNLVNRLRDDGIETVWSSLPEETAIDLHCNGLELSQNHVDLDHAIAWCEDQLLLEQGIDPQAIVSDFDPRLTAVMHRRTLAPRDVLIQAGAEDRDLFFVQSGLLTAWVTSTGGRRIRLRQVTAGAVLGEVAFCRGGFRTADVIANTEVEVLVLERSRFDELATTDPEVALAFQQLLLDRLADRVANTSAMVRDLLR